MSFVDYDTECPALYKLIEERKWDSIPPLLASEPESASTWVYRKSPSGKVRWCVLPLHLASASNCPPSVIGAIVRAHLPAMRLRAYATNELEYAPSEVSDVDFRKGDLPIHYLCEWGNGPHIVLLFLRSYPKSIGERDSRGKDVLEIAMGSGYRGKEAMIGAIEHFLDPSKPLPEPISADYSPLTETRQDSDCWDYDADECVLFRAIQDERWAEAAERLKSSPGDASKWVYRKNAAGFVRWCVLPVHLACARDVPVTLMSRLVRADVRSLKERSYQVSDPEQACKNVAGCDFSEGNLPVHYAAEWGVAPSIAYMAVRAYPASNAAKCSRGYLPLQIARNSSCEEAKRDGMCAAFEKAAGDAAYEIPFVNIAVETKRKEEAVKSGVKIPKGMHVDTVVIARNGDHYADYDGDARPTLFSLVEKELWDKVVERCERHWEEASTWVFRRNIEGKIRWAALPIHSACARDVPLEAFQALLRANFDGATRLAFQASGNLGKAPSHVNPLGNLKAGNLAVHLAARWGVDGDVFDMLLRAFPESVDSVDRRGLPLRKAIDGCDDESRKRGMTDALGDVLSSLGREGELEAAVAAEEAARAAAAPVVPAADDADGLGVSIEEELGIAPEDTEAPAPAPPPAAATTTHPLALPIDDPDVLLLLDRAPSDAPAPSSAVPFSSAPELFRLVEAEDWDGVAARVAAAPAEADAWVVATDDAGAVEWCALPVHAACARDCPKAVLTKLLRANLKSLKAPAYQAVPGTVCTDVTEADFGCGNLPVHYTAQWGADADVVYTLLKANPASAKQLDVRGMTVEQIAETTGCEKRAEVALGVQCFKDPQAYKKFVLDQQKEEALKADHFEYGSNRTELYGHVEAQRWDQVIERARSHPDEAKIWVYKTHPSKRDVVVECLLPLHEASRKDCPKTGVLAILRANIGALKLRSFRDPDGALGVRRLSGIDASQGDLPIHLCCEHGMEPPVVYTMLKAYPESLAEPGKEGMKPAELAQAKDAYNKDDVQYAIRRFNDPSMPPLTGYKKRNGGGSGPAPANGDKSAAPAPAPPPPKPAGPPRVYKNYDTECTPLYKHIEAKEWKEALKALKADPSSAKTWVYRANPDGSVKWTALPLHAACTKKCPTELVAPLIRANVLAIKSKAFFQEDAASAPPSLDRVDPDVGTLPVHYACQFGMPAAVVKTFLKVHPPSVLAIGQKRGWTPWKVASESSCAEKPGTLEALVAFQKEHPEIQSDIPDAVP